MNIKWRYIKPIILVLVIAILLIKYMSNYTYMPVNMDDLASAEFKYEKVQKQVIVTEKNAEMLAAFFNSLRLVRSKEVSDKNFIFQVNFIYDDSTISTVKIYTSFLTINNKTYVLEVDKMDYLISLLEEKFYYLKDGEGKNASQVGTRSFTLRTCPAPPPW